MYFEVSTQKVFSAFMLHVVQERCVVLSELLVRGCDTDIEARRWRPWAHSRAPRASIRYPSKRTVVDLTPQLSLTRASKLWWGRRSAPVGPRGAESDLGCEVRAVCVF